MGTSLDDPSVFQNHDGITIPDSGQSVCDNEYGTSLHQVIHTLLHDTLCTGIDAGSCLVQNQYRRVCDGGSGDCQQLTLSLRQFFTVTGKYRIISRSTIPRE